MKEIADSTVWRAGSIAVEPRGHEVHQRGSRITSCCAPMNAAVLFKGTGRKAVIGENPDQRVRHRGTARMNARYPVRSFDGFLRKRFAGRRHERKTLR